MLIVACGIGQILLEIRKIVLPGLNMPIHVMCMLAGIIIRLIMDKTGKGSDELYEVIDNVGEISLALFVSLSIITMKLWQLIDLALPLLTILFLQLVLIYLFVPSMPAAVTTTLQSSPLATPALAWALCPFPWLP